MKLNMKISKDNGWPSPNWAVITEQPGGPQMIVGLNWFFTWDEALDYALMERRHHEERIGATHEPPC